SRVLARAETSSRYTRLITRQPPGVAPLRSHAHLIGRDPQKDAILASIGQLDRSGQDEPKSPPLTVLLADPGMGTSLLLASIRDIVLLRGMDCYIGVTEPLRRRVPYYACREPLALILGVHRLSTSAALTQLGTLIPSDHHLAGRLSLIGDVLALKLIGDPPTYSMSADQRATLTRSLLVTAVRARCQRRPAVLMLDDCQWLDDSSWRLVLALQDVPGLLVVLAHHRPRHDEVGHIDALLHRPQIQRIELGMLPVSDIVALACKLVAVSCLSGRLEALIVSRSAGNPFFCETLINTLQEAGAIESVDGCARLKSSLSLATLDLPATIQGAITARLDHLPEAEQLTLKVAAVIGMSFTLDALAATHPCEHDRARLRDELDYLVGVGMCAPASARHAYAFRHNAVRETCIGLLLPDQLRVLHAALAQWLEFQAPHPPAHDRLAYHHRHAGHIRRTMEQLQLAGLQALALGADREAADALAESLALADEHEAACRLSTVRRAELLCGLGTAQHRLGETQQGALDLRQALEAIGHPLPRGRLAWFQRLVSEALGQLLWRSGMGPLLPRSQVGLPLIIASRAASWYADISYLRLDPLAWLVSGLVAANLAERGGDLAVAGPAFVNLATICGTLRLRGLERAYLRLAGQAPEPRVALMARWSQAMVHMAHGCWDQAAASVSIGVEQGRRVGDRWALVNGYTIQGLGLQLSGRPRDSLASFAAAREIADSDHGPRQGAWCRIFSVPTLLSLGDLKQAEELLQVPRDGPTGGDPIANLAWHGAVAGLLLRQGLLDDAVRHATTFVEQVGSMHLTVFSYSGLLCLAGESLLAAEALGGPVADQSPAQLSKLRKAAVRALYRGGRLFRYFRPSALMLDGTAAWQAGRLRRAQTLWADALRLTQALAMPAMEGRIHVEIARHQPADSDLRTVHMNVAKRLLEPCGATGDLALVSAPSPSAALPAQSARASTTTAVP
ncbi:MAG: AAA family ATPase, partial [Oligoflexia bacterium]|nr:AAA family ATPase [Oligoflexia bacterium]